MAADFLSSAPGVASPVKPTVPTNTGGGADFLSSGPTQTSPAVKQTPVTPSGGGDILSATPVPQKSTVSNEQGPNVPNYFQEKSPSGTFLGISNEKDISGTPYFAYKPPGAATTTDYTRVATTFDPRVPQVLNPSHIQNGRMPLSVSAPIKTQLGGQYSDELDHSIALELSGSNNPANLRVEPGRGGLQTPPGESAKFDTEENFLAHQVATGKMSLWDAQYKLASDKHAAGDKNPLPFMDKNTAAAKMTFPVGQSTLTTPKAFSIENNHLNLQSASLKQAYSDITKMKVDVHSQESVDAYNAKVAQYKAQADIFNARLDSYNTAIQKQQESLNFDQAAQGGANIPKGMGEIGSDTLSALLAPPAPKNISFGDAVSAGWNTITSSISDLADRINTLGQKIGSGASFGEDATAAGEVGMGLINQFFAVPSAALSTLSHAPGMLGYSADLINNFFGALGTGGSETLVSAWDRLPISSAAKDKGRQLVGEVGALVAQMIGGKVGGDILGEFTDKTKVITDTLKPEIDKLRSTTDHASTLDEATPAPLPEPKTNESTSVFHASQDGKLFLDENNNVNFGTSKDEITQLAGNTGKVSEIPLKGLTVQDFPTKEAMFTAASTDKQIYLDKGIDILRSDNHVIGINAEKVSKASGVPLGQNFREQPISALTSKESIQRAANSPDTTNVADVKTIATPQSAGTIQRRLAELEKTQNHLTEMMKGHSGEVNTSLKQSIERVKQEIKTLQSTVPAVPEEPIGLPEFPVQGDKSVVLSASFPGAGTITKFVEKDVIPAGKNVINTVKDIYQSMKTLFYPPEGYAKTAAVTGAALMRAEQVRSAAWKVADARRTWWASVSEDVKADFIDRMETGSVTADEFPKNLTNAQRTTFAQLAKEYRARLDTTYDYEKSVGVKINYIKEYFPHLWKDAEKAKIAFIKLANSMGKGAFTKLRTIDFIKTGREMGLELKTTNPEELVLMRELDGVRVGAHTEIMNELKANGLAMDLGTPGSEGWPRVIGPDGKMYAVVPEGEKVLQNALWKTDLWSKPGVVASVFRSVMAIKGIFVPLKLAISMFHPIHIAFIRMADGLTTAQEALLHGTMTPGEGLGEMAKQMALVFQVPEIKDNYSLVKAWDKPPSQWTDREKTAIGYIIDGGGTPKMSEENLIRARDGFRAALKDQNFIGAAIRGVPKLMEAYQKPIFETYIPSLKLASYLKTVEHLLRANPEFATNDLARRVAFREAWQSIDNRFGQMNYKTNFWNPTLKNIGQASFLSLGWQLGFVREFGGGALDLGTLIKNAVRGEGSIEDVSGKLLFSLNYTMIAATVGGLMTYAMTGQRPTKMIDFFYPATGDKNPDGSPARVNTSFYTREFFTLYNNWKTNGLIGGTWNTTSSKLNPILAALGDLYMNKDFQNVEIRDANAPAATQAAQAFQYWINQTAVPISWGGAQKSGSTPKSLTLGLSGFNPAPAFVNRNDTQTAIVNALNLRTGGTKSLESKTVTNAKNNIRDLYWSGDTAGANAALDKAISDGYITDRGKAAFVKALDLPSDVKEFQLLAQYPSDQEAILAKMSESDLARYSNYASSKIKNHLSQLSPQAYQFVQDLKSGKIQLDQFRKGQVINQ